MNMTNANGWSKKMWKDIQMTSSGKRDDPSVKPLLEMKN